ncbi:hypothetical protein X975_03440, partial [Stegodyphus mimosarum]
MKSSYQKVFLSSSLLPAHTSREKKGALYHQHSMSLWKFTF